MQTMTKYHNLIQTVKKHVCAEMGATQSSEFAYKVLPILRGVGETLKVSDPEMMVDDFLRECGFRLEQIPTKYGGLQEPYVEAVSNG